GDAALSSTLRAQAVSDSRLQGEANLRICPNLDAANILLNVLKAEVGPGLTIGPLLLGTAAPAHVLTSAAVSRRIINATAVAVAEAGARRLGNTVQG
ncbi:MAG: NADP-dependent malic enzyme, partial [Ottowia sp.]|nr:NADP-dependent malic enzyme [Ottowia sp.]